MQSRNHTRMQSRNHTRMQSRSHAVMQSLSHAVTHSHTSETCRRLKTCTEDTHVILNVCEKCGKICSMHHNVPERAEDTQVVRPSVSRGGRCAVPRGLCGVASEHDFRGVVCAVRLAAGPWTQVCPHPPPALLVNRWDNKSACRAHWVTAKAAG